MTYKDLLPKVDKKIAHATTVRWGTAEGIIDGLNGRQHEDQSKVLIVRFHETDILYLYPDGSVRVYSGGWRTPKTRGRVREYGDIHIQSWEGLWFVYRDSENVESRRGTKNLTPFYDGMLFDPKGTPTAPREETYDSMMKRKHALDRVVRRYIKEFAAALKKQVAKNGEMQKPDGGDCWYCSMFGDKAGSDHIINHFEEGYYVPALLFNAITERHSSTSWQSGRPSAEEVKKRTSFDWFAAESDFKHGREDSWFVSRALRTYLSKRKWRLLESFDPVAFKKAYKDGHAEEA